MATSDLQLRVLFQLNRALQNPELQPTDHVDQLWRDLFEQHGNRSGHRLGDRSTRFDLSTAKDWDTESLERAVFFAEEISAQYTHLFHDSRVIPVTYYKREKTIRRYLDHHFSVLFNELISRTHREHEKELITEEPIYYLMQIARERNFPKDKGGRPNLALLKQRIHLDLSHRLLPEGHEQMRRVLLPHEIRRR
jgi:hypothetical protein